MGCVSSIGIIAIVLAQSALALQSRPARMDVDDAHLRRAAYLYPTPEYPAASIKANHAGRVVVAVVVGIDGNNGTYARVQSTKVLESPDADIAASVIAAANKSRYTPIGNGKGNLVDAVAHIVWEFKITNG